MTEAKHGDRVSINGSKRNYFFQTEGGISLAAGTSDTTLIPKTASDLHLKQINNAIRRDELRLGRIEQVIDVPDRDSDLKKISNMKASKLIEWLLSLREDKTKRDVEKSETLEKLLDLEKSGPNRKDVIKRIESSLRYIAGISRVEDSEQTKVEIKLTNNNEPEENLES